LGARRLPENRWSRAVAFGVVGLGLGLTLTFTMSALRVLTPDQTAWLPLLVGGTVVGFVVGYLTPGAEPAQEDLDDDARAPVDDDDGLAARLGLRAPTSVTLPGNPAAVLPAGGLPPVSAPPAWGGSTGSTGSSGSSTIFDRPSTGAPPGEL
ncbi:MAG: hypothetical protein ACYDB7_06810, partial [Mycobacteriales bacterium]